MRARVLAAILTLVAGLAGCIGETSPSSPAATSTNTTANASSDDAAAGDGPQWAPPEEAALRPGASLGGYCTFTFLFTAPNGTAYVGTAGHCTSGPGERVELGSDGGEIGTVVLDSDNASAIDDSADFALVRLDEEVVSDANPSVLGWEGPTGVLDASDAAQGDRVGFHGYGVLLGQQPYTRARDGVLVSMDEQQYDADMPAVNGDSGSPIVHLATSKALGIVSHYGISDVPPTTDEGPTLAFILDQLHAHGWDVDLATVG